MIGMGHDILEKAMRRPAPHQVWRGDQGRRGDQDPVSFSYEDCDMIRCQYLSPSGFRQIVSEPRHVRSEMPIKNQEPFEIAIGGPSRDRRHILHPCFT